MDLYVCSRLRAKISKRQCEINRKGYQPKGGVKIPPIATCQGCAGLGLPAHVPIPKEGVSMKKLKHIYCGHKGCYAIVKKEGEFCKKHQGLEDQVAAGVVAADPPVESEKKLSDVIVDAVADTDPAPQEIPAGSICAVCVGDCSAGPTPCEPGMIAYCVNFVPWRRDDERTQAMLGLVGCSVSLEMLKQQSDQDVMAAEFYAGALHIQASDNEDVAVPPMPFFLKGTQTPAPTSAEAPVERKSIDEATPEEWTAASRAVLAAEPTKSGLHALLRTPPPAPVGMFIPFDQEEIAVLTDREVTPEVIREFIIMGLEGKLQPVEAA